jgi:hypothetical protein
MPAAALQSGEEFKRGKLWQDIQEQYAVYVGAIMKSSY